MKIIKTIIPGCFEIVPNIFKDERGLFVKTFHQDIFEENRLNIQWAEEYYSISRQGVLRGLHFQLPPHDHVKLVYCLYGEVFDAVVDLRKGSPTFGKYAIFRLNADQANMLYIPSGLAHGFYTLTETATMMYKVSTVYAPEHDTGILWNSANIPWPDTNPIISARDRGFIPLKSFQSPFVFES